MTALILQFNAGMRRAACPLAGPRLAGALVGVGMAWWLLPVTVGCAAIGGYRDALKAVLTPPPFDRETDDPKPRKRGFPAVKGIPDGHV